MSAKTYSTIEPRIQQAIERLNSKKKSLNVAAIAQEYEVLQRPLDIMTKAAETKIKKQWKESSKQMRIGVRGRNKKHKF